MIGVGLPAADPRRRRRARSAPAAITTGNPAAHRNGEDPVPRFSASLLELRRFPRSTRGTSSPCTGIRPSGRVFRGSLATDGRASGIGRGSTRPRLRAGTSASGPLLSARVDGREPTRRPRPAKFAPPARETAGSAPAGRAAGTAASRGGSAGARVGAATGGDAGDTAGGTGAGGGGTGAGGGGAAGGGASGRAGRKRRGST
jgi:hypothetical protein